ncbi:type IV pilus modification PilV family protein [Aquibacillus rhizosphaerae]|uniref:Type II secretion system protein n=1 Tax=Aquibacillus rhizosphaerae TaxID=3051431 RepID=A0ABT7L770_9BACI|nr:type II secretion system protein [Aquibacillus sp. LR5S19]MDL4841681.1 type II secretion system protein [Aquibacillus sp. LR5S19]
MQKQLKRLLSSKGMTLVEILASIMILSIIVVTFLTLFIQSARTNSISEDIMDATYVAQTQMEEIYNLSTTSEQNINVLQDQSSCDADTSYIFTEKNGDFCVKVRMKDSNIVDLKDVVVEVYRDNKLESKMETKLNWSN